MTALRAANLGLKFILELAAIASFAYWGGTVGTGAISILVALATPLAAAVLWGVFAAPRSERRLPTRSRIAFELVFFALAALALTSATIAGAIVFALVVVANTVLLTVFAQWEN